MRYLIKFIKYLIKFSI